MKKLTYMILGGLLALALVFGAAATFAFQSGDDDEVTATPEGSVDEAQSDEAQSDETQSDDSSQAPALPGFGPHGPGGFAGRIGDGDGELLAEALGITVEELQAAYEEAWTAAIEQAVADGLITQEQADELLEGDGGFRGRFHHGFFGLGNMDEYLAEALGISVEELQAARAEASAARLAELVEAGAITQEQADLIAAQQAVQNYIDQEALQATIQSAYEAAVEQALADGAITQEQADQLLENSMPGFGFSGFGGFGGGHHGGFRGGPGWGIPPANGQLPADPAAGA
ncbi:MAG: hypothetical protein L0332_30750 [Chloroflexi bacterium]|nr:hypothetical protein [Chloroflexota bacterium]MCI0579806.1 hypothetical protein [Chloroflexota bacterium]MCI0644580.1 hypothetical protein [Chloroflexota bacterium]MCI0731079.1 hypothetical protein [Chloroflexota bacterium]